MASLLDFALEFHYSNEIRFSRAKQIQRYSFDGSDVEVGRAVLEPVLLAAFGSARFWQSAVCIPQRGGGARNAVAYYVFSWVHALCARLKVAVHASDVSGAFGRVYGDALRTKLLALALHGDVIAVITSWLRDRPATVIVGGHAPREFSLSNMVLQGAVCGPYLWNVHFGDSVCAIHICGFTAMIYADYLNASK